MKKRLGVLAAAALAATVVVVALTASGSAQPAGQVTTIRLVQREGLFHYVDNPPRRRFSAGDVFTIQTRLYNEANTTRVGTGFVVCTATRGGREARQRAQCNGTFRLGGGQLAVSFGGNPAGAVTVAVTGGTGAYAGRDGSARITQRTRTSENVTITLLR